MSKVKNEGRAWEGMGGQGECNGGCQNGREGVPLFGRAMVCQSNWLHRQALCEWPGAGGCGRRVVLRVRV